MKLRAQLLLVTAVVAALPLAGWQIVRQIEHVLREGHEQVLVDNARNLAALLTAAGSEAWPARSEPGLYVHATAQPLFLDGYSDDWAPWLEQAQRFEAAGGPHGVDFIALENAAGLHLLMRVEDPVPLFARPGGDAVRSGDHVRLWLELDGAVHERVLSAMAPGWIQAGGSGSARVQGMWQTRGGGWMLELQVPGGDRLTGLGFEIVSRDRWDGDAVRFGTGDASGGVAAWPLIRPVDSVTRRLAGIVPPETRAWVISHDGWVLGHADHRSGLIVSDPPEVAGLRTVIFERLLSAGLRPWPGRGQDSGRLRGEEVEQALAGAASAVWQSTATGIGAEIAAAAPVRVAGRVVGAVVIERDADAMLLLTHRAVIQLFGWSTLALGVVALVLLGFAALLSERIRRLRNAAETAVGADGRVGTPFRPPRAGDELGDLGRSVSTLLQRLQAHQDYLRRLADRLAHELRTPLAMIRSSLDNLEHSRDHGDVQRYTKRAGEGADRLNRILQAMSQAARLEDSLTGEPLASLDLAELARGYVAACRDTHPRHRFEFDSDGRPAMINGSAELLAQLLDKLVENAVTFAPAGATIRLRVAVPATGQARLDVDNPGPPLPETMRERLFEPMVSVRSRRGDNPNLGLGLYVARLIAEYHGGRLRGIDTEGGVRFRLEIETDTIRQSVHSEKR